MTDDLKELLIPIVISVPFFIFGFAITANMLELTFHDVIVGTFAGGVCGLVTLGVVLYRAGKTPHQPTSAA